MATTQGYYNLSAKQTLLLLMFSSKPLRILPLPLCYVKHPVQVFSEAVLISLFLISLLASLLSDLFKRMLSSFHFVVWTIHLFLLLQSFSSFNLTQKGFQKAKKVFCKTKYTLIRRHLYPYIYVSVYLYLSIYIYIYMYVLSSLFGLC